MSLTAADPRVRAKGARLTADRVVAYGSVYDAIMKVAADIDADLIVMASRRPELKDYLLGANAARVVRPLDRSVLVVRD